MFLIDPKFPQPLVVQIVDGYKRLVAERKLRPGMKIPSIRQYAEANRVSMSTVVEAYDRLVAEGVLVPRQNMGFFVRELGGERHREPPRDGAEAGFDALWLIRKVWETQNAEFKPGCGWLPEAWLDDDSLKRNLRSVAARSGSQLVGYGVPKGLAALRWKIADWLREREVYANPEQVLMTSGAMQALSLVARYLLKSGDVALVDDPGYGILVSFLRAAGVHVVGVPWGEHGPQLEPLESLAQAHAPKAFFTNPRLQNPCGASYDAPTSHRVLQLAERYGFMVVEDDIYAELLPGTGRCLASMDQLNRVIYVNGFSKTIAPSLRVGYLAAHPDVVEDLTMQKMVTGLTSCEITERLVHEVLSEGRHRKHLRVLRERLAEAREQTCRRLEECGLEIRFRAEAGMFVMARLAEVEDSTPLCNEAIGNGILLAPGQLFAADEHASPWLRFNVAHCGAERIFEYLRRARRGAGAARRASSPS